jgi:hypothetical protein
MDNYEKNKKVKQLIELETKYPDAKEHDIGYLYLKPHITEAAALYAAINLCKRKVAGKKALCTVVRDIIGFVNPYVGAAAYAIDTLTSLIAKSNCNTKLLISLEEYLKSYENNTYTHKNLQFKYEVFNSRLAGLNRAPEDHWKLISIDCV